ncbi:putative protein F44E2.4, partial [Dissostichus eleginoides]
NTERSFRPGSPRLLLPGILRSPGAPHGPLPPGWRMLSGRVKSQHPEEAQRQKHGHRAGHLIRVCPEREGDVPVVSALAAGPTVSVPVAEPLPVALSAAGPPVLWSGPVAEPLPVPLSMAGPPVLGSAPTADPLRLLCPRPGRRKQIVSTLQPEWLSLKLLQESADIRQCAVEFYKELYKTEFQARALLERCGGLGLAESLFLMDLKGLRLNNLSGFYGGLFKVWGLLRKERPDCCGSLFWLLREPVVRGSRFVCGVGPSLQQRLCEERILTLGQVVEVCGPAWTTLQAWPQQLICSQFLSSGETLRPAEEPETLRRDSQTFRGTRDTEEGLSDLQRNQRH